MRTTRCSTESARLSKDNADDARRGFTPWGPKTTDDGRFKFEPYTIGAHGSIETPGCLLGPNRRSTIPSVSNGSPRTGHFGDALLMAPVVERQSPARFWSAVTNTNARSRLSKMAFIRQSLRPASRCRVEPVSTDQVRQVRDREDATIPTMATTTTSHSEALSRAAEMQFSRHGSTILLEGSSRDACSGNPIALQKVKVRKHFMPMAVWIADAALVVSPSGRAAHLGCLDSLQLAIRRRACKQFGSSGHRVPRCVQPPGVVRVNTKLALVEREGPGRRRPGAHAPPRAERLLVLALPERELRHESEELAALRCQGNAPSKSTPGARPTGNAEVQRPGTVALGRVVVRGAQHLSAAPTAHCPSARRPCR